MGISETVSENQPRRKRGRPVAFCEELLQRNTWPDVKTRRGLQNKAYLVRAFGLLIDDSKFAWLCDKSSGVLRQVILAELGRIEDDDQLREVAAYICETKPRSKAAAATIRRLRNRSKGPGKLGVATDMLLAILKFIDRYSTRHHCTFDDIRRALQEAIVAVAETEREQGNAGGV